MILLIGEKSSNTQSPEWFVIAQSRITRTGARRAASLQPLLLGTQSAPLSPLPRLGRDVRLYLLVVWRRFGRGSDGAHLFGRKRIIC